MASLAEVRAERVKKAELLAKAGMELYPASTKRNKSIKDVIDSFAELEASGEEFVVAGRVLSRRLAGAICFADISDGTERLQAFLKKDEMAEEHYQLFVDAIDIGDFIEITAKAFTTQRGASAMLVSGWRVLSKSLLPLPGEYYGFKDEEERLRKRYLDILMNEDTRQLVYQRSTFWNTMRSFLLSRDFVEVETPVLETTPGGADARTFDTHHNALDIETHLRISAGELWQKKLMVAGIPRTFEIGRIFRNEGMSAEHAQDYTQMEFYAAYLNYRDGMKLVQELYRELAEKTFGTLEFKVGEHTFNLGDEWEEIEYVPTIEKMTGINPLEAPESEVIAKVKELGIEHESDLNRERATDQLWKWCRKQISGPAFLLHPPAFLEPLAKRKSDEREVVERFQILLGGSEVGKGYSELNDPIDQAERFAHQQELRDAGDDEAQRMDESFVEALEHGMPPTCGFGVSERLFSFLAGLPIKEAQLFPLLKPKETAE